MKMKKPAKKSFDATAFAASIGITSRPQKSVPSLDMVKQIQWESKVHLIVALTDGSHVEMYWSEKRRRFVRIEYDV